MPSVFGCFILKGNGSSSRSDLSDVPANNDGAAASCLALSAKQVASHQIEGRRRAAHGDAGSAGSTSNFGGASTLGFLPSPPTLPPLQQGQQQQQEYSVEGPLYTERITLSPPSAGRPEEGTLQEAAGNAGSRGRGSSSIVSSQRGCCHEGGVTGARLRAYLKAILTAARLPRRGPAAVAVVAVPKGPAAAAPAVLAAEDRALQDNATAAGTGRIREPSSARDPLPAVSVLPSPFLLYGGSFLRPSLELETTPCQPILGGNCNSPLLAVARSSGVSITRYPALQNGLLHANLSGSGTGSVSVLGVGGGLPGASSIGQGLPKEALLNLSRFAGSTDRDDDLSTVGSLNSTTQYPLPLLGSKTSGLIVEEGGVGFTELMKSAALRNTGIAALPRSIAAGDTSGAVTDAEFYLASPFGGARGNPFDLSGVGGNGSSAFSELPWLGPPGWPPAVEVPLLACYPGALVDATSALQLAEDVSQAVMSPGLADGWVVGHNRAPAASSVFPPGLQLSPMPRCRTSWGRIRSCGVRGGVTSLTQVPEEEPSVPRGSTELLFQAAAPSTDRVYSPIHSCHLHSCHLGLDTQEDQEVHSQARNASTCDTAANLARSICDLLATAEAQAHTGSNTHVCGVCSLATVATAKVLCEGSKISAVHLPTESELALSTVYGIDEGDRWSPRDGSDAVGKKEVATAVNPESAGHVIGQVVVAEGSGDGGGGRGGEFQEDAAAAERLKSHIQIGAVVVVAAAAADSQQQVDLRPRAASTQGVEEEPPSAVGLRPGKASTGGPEGAELVVDPKTGRSSGAAPPAITIHGFSTGLAPLRVQAPSAGSDLIAEWVKEGHTTVLGKQPCDGAADADAADAISPDEEGPAAGVVDSWRSFTNGRCLTPDRLRRCDSLRIRVQSDLHDSNCRLAHGGAKSRLEGERLSSYGATRGTTSIDPSSALLGMIDTEHSQLGRGTSQMMSAFTPEPGSPLDSRFASPVTRLASGCETPYTPYVYTQHPLQAMQVDPSEVVLGKLIGRGCAGRVYKGTFRGEVVAVKVITHCEAEAGSGRNPQPLTEEVVKNLEKEAALAYVLKHPNIVATYAAFTRVSSPGPLTQPYSSASRASSLQPSGLATQTQLQGALERSTAASRATPYSSPTILLPRGTPPPLLELNAAAVAAQPTRWYPSSPSCRGPLLLAVASGAGAGGAGGGFTSSPVTNGLCRSIWQMPSGSTRTSAGPGGSSGGEAVIPSQAGDGSVVAGSAAAAALDRSPPGMFGSAPTAVSSSAFTVAIVSPSGGGGGGRSSSLGSAMRSGPCRWEVFIVMELCPCGSLRAALDAKMLHNKKGVPHLHEVLPLAWEIACALQYLHANNVVHGDLKAANVMLAEAPTPQHSNLDNAAAAVRSGSGITSASSPSLGSAQPILRPTYTAKVADFSHSYQVELALQRLREGEGNSGGDAAADGASELASPSHAAPELFEEGGQPTFQSDIYALGVVLWELYSGRRPYDKYTVGEVLASKRTVPTTEVLVISESWIPEYGKVCAQCWLPPAERPSLRAIVTTLILVCRAKLPHVQLCCPVALDPDPDRVTAALYPTWSYDVLGMPAVHLPGMVVDTAERRQVEVGALAVGRPSRVLPPVMPGCDMTAARGARGCGSNTASAAAISTCHRTLSYGVMQDDKDDVVRERFRQDIQVTYDKNNLATIAVPTSPWVSAPESAEANPYVSPGEVWMSSFSSRVGTADGASRSHPVYVPLPPMPGGPQEVVLGPSPAPPKWGLAVLGPEADLAASSQNPSDHDEDPRRCGSQGGTTGAPAAAGSAMPSGGIGGGGGGARSGRRTAASGQDCLLSRLEPLLEAESCHLRLLPEHPQGCIRMVGPSGAAGGACPLESPRPPVPSRSSAATTTNASAAGSGRNKSTTHTSLVQLETSPCRLPNTGPFASTPAGGGPPQHRSRIENPPISAATAALGSSCLPNSAAVAAAAADAVVGNPSVALSGCTGYVVAPEESTDTHQTSATATRPRAAHERIMGIVFLDGAYGGEYGRFCSSACITEAGNGSAAVQTEHTSGGFIASHRSAAAVSVGTGAGLRLGPAHGRGSSGASPWGAGRFCSGSLEHRGVQAGTGAGVKPLRSSTHSGVHGAISASSLHDGTVPGVGGSVAAAAATRVSVAASSGGGCGLRGALMPYSPQTVSHTALPASIERTSGLPLGIEMTTIACCNDVSTTYGGAPGARSPAATLSGFFGINKFGRQHSRNFTTRELEAVWTSIPRFSDAPPSPSPTQVSMTAVAPLCDSYGGAP
ncbi:hypothetical protein Vafri_664 [Volvox africanus]|nr:hypothetical protein Vafri_664 [Volvox africanus]